MSIATETKSDEQVQMNAFEFVELSPPKVYKSVSVWKGAMVLRDERVMNYALEQIRNKRCIVEGCRARKFKSGMCRKHSKVVQ